MRKSLVAAAFALSSSLLLATGSAALAAPTPAPAPAEAETAADPAVAAAGIAPHVVQLGDSYSAGNGARDPQGNPAYDAAAPTCYRSAYNYGQQFATTIGATYTNVACSGGVFADLRTPNAQAGAPAQIDAVDQNADVVLMTMGGNDIGFTNIVVQCFVLRLGDACREQISAAVASLPQLEETAYAEITAIRAKMRADASFIYVGYPNLSSASSLVLPTLDGLGYDVIPALDGLLAGGAQVQAAAVERVNADSPCGARTFYLDDVDEAFEGHEIDQSKPVIDSATWFWNVGETLTIAESYHPKPAGWAAEAALVTALYADQVQSAPSLDVTPTDVAQGSSVELSGSGFRSGEQVQLALAPDIDTVVSADQCGAFTATIDLSSSTPTGQRVVTATSVATGASADDSFTVTAAPSPPTTTTPPVTEPAAPPTPTAEPDPVNATQSMSPPVVAAGKPGTSGGAGVLANTGSGELGDLAIVAAALMLAGGGLLLSGRRRSR